MSAKMLAEINEIPLKALEFLQQSRTYFLSLWGALSWNGSSFFAPLAFKYMGVDIQPELASEYFKYLPLDTKL